MTNTALTAYEALSVAQQLHATPLEHLAQ